MSSPRISFVPALMLLLVTAPAFAQAVKGSLLGTVTDSSGATVAAAAVEVAEVRTGITRTAVTNQSGGIKFYRR